MADAGASAYADLARDLAPGDSARLFRPGEEETPLGWETASARPIIQMVAEEGSAPGDAAQDGLAIEPLGLADAPAMLALADLTRPGPFAARTVVLGDYLGLRREGRLLAMAGHRFRLPGFVELSAISVHPELRGRGVGLGLTRALMRDAFSRGQVPFLHVYPDNPAAGLYERLGFRERARPWVIERRPRLFR